MKKENLKPMTLTIEIANHIADKKHRIIPSSEYAKGIADIYENMYVELFNLKKEYFHRTNAFGAITIFYIDKDHIDPIEGGATCYMLDTFPYVPNKEENKFINKSIKRLLDDIRNMDDEV